MPRIDIYGNPTQTSHIDHLRRFLASLIDAAGTDNLHAEPAYLAFIHSVAPELASSLQPITPTDTPPALALSIGGDGTFLTTANHICGSNPPIMGINAGHLGYLSAADISAADSVACQIAAGEYFTEPRTLIKVSSPSAQLPDKPFALNEVAFLRQDTASIITVDTWVNNQFLASYSADGLIVSTPTGSTGYNLSAGGPIMSPRCSDWIITPVAAHSLSMRPLVVPDSAEIRIRVSSRSKVGLLAIDGKATPFPDNTEFTLTKAPFHISVAHLSDHTFANTLRHKLHWG